MQYFAIFFVPLQRVSIFTIVTRGWLTILYNNRELTLHEGDLYTYSPGFEITILSSSSDYSGICLLRQTSLSITQISDQLHFAECRHDRRQCRRIRRPRRAMALPVGVPLPVVKTMA